MNTTTRNSTENLFYCPDEKKVAEIGTSRLKNLTADLITGSFSGNINKNMAILTDKRLYFSGNNINIFSKNLGSTLTKRVVNVRDITGVGYSAFKSIIWLVLALLILGYYVMMAVIMGSWLDSLVPFIPGVILITLFLVIYYASKKTVLLIEYTGGFIAFDLRWIEKYEHENFVRHIQMIKDKIYSSVAVDQGFKNSNTE